MKEQLCAVKGNQAKLPDCVLQSETNEKGGQVVRRLALGHQPAGMYQNCSGAAYWDGRNAFGEPVACGVYFYTLTAGDFTATWKMLIRK